MTPVKILLDQKREGRELDAADIRALIAAYTSGDIPDYQMAAFAMAVCCRGMTGSETFALTDAMRLSGACLDWDGIALPTADKHSTGGVGDKLSLIIQPLAAACGLAVPSLTGRGLGLTGGTADKLESIPGYIAGLSLSQFRKTVSECGVSMTVQTDEITPADKKLYALRDVTGTVPSIPLIVASILSKKLAEGVGTLVFDVKCGEGAFMQTRADASALAHELVAGAKAAGRKSAACVTAMDEPLGFTVGNSLETEEAIRILKGEIDVPDVTELSVAFAARMVSLASGIELAAAERMCRERLADGSAFKRFAEMVRLHGGDLEAFARVCTEGAAAPRIVAAASGGWVEHISARKIAEAAAVLGAGRMKAGDAIDPAAGVRLLVSHGDMVNEGEPVAELYAPQKPDALDVAASLAAAAFSFSAEKPDPKPLVLETVA